MIARQTYSRYAKREHSPQKVNSTKGEAGKREVKNKKTGKRRSARAKICSLSLVNIYDDNDSMKEHKYVLSIMVNKDRSASAARPSGEEITLRQK